MKQIRIGTFETNSSSTHSMVIAMASDFEKWEKGELYANYSGELITKDEAVELYQEAKDGDETFIPFEEWINTWDAELWDYDNWNLDLATEEHTFTTPNGEVIKTMCAYGNNY